MKTADVVILGSSISAELAACHLRKHLPSLSVTVVGPSSERRPIVGESTISITARFLIELGLGALLVEKHYPKYALTYYYKDRLEDPADRAYHVSESPFVLPELSYNLNRFTFDAQLRAHSEALGAQHLTGRVTQVDLEHPARRRVTIKGENGETYDIAARWIIDASGRNRILARQLDLQTEYPPFIAQRSSFWFRLKDFDRSILSRIQAIKKPNRSYDSYYVTHHFLGRGNWIWAIPMRDEDGGALISIGICYREDRTERHVTHMEQFLEAVATEHPVVVELVRSGEVLDVQQYRRYMYDCKQMYSGDGWYLIGDAARTVDPLYSTGIANTTMQVQQVTELIRLSHRGEDTAEVARAFDSAMRTVQYGAQADISALYDVMHDRYQCQSRMHLSTWLFFYLLAPNIANGNHCDPASVTSFSSLLGLDSEVGKELLALFALIERTSHSPHLRLADYPEVQDVDAFNVEYFGHLRREEIPRSLARLRERFARYRTQLEEVLRRGPLDPAQAPSPVLSQPTKMHG